MSVMAFASSSCGTVTPSERAASVRKNTCVPQCINSKIAAADRMAGNCDARVAGRGACAIADRMGPEMIRSTPAPMIWCVGLSSASKPASNPRNTWLIISAAPPSKKMSTPIPDQEYAGPSAVTSRVSPRRRAARYFAPIRHNSNNNPEYSSACAHVKNVSTSWRMCQPASV